MVLAYSLIGRILKMQMLRFMAFLPILHLCISQLAEEQVMYK
nr:MAG TPA: hypothetical protein [Bacteriophage sp.]